MIADLNAQIANADSSSTIGHLFHLATEVERLSAGVAEYDSSELISTAAEVGSVRYVDDGTLRVYDSDNWRNILTEYSPTPSAPTEPWGGFRGTLYGYSSKASLTTSTINKFSLSSNGNASDIGNLNLAVSNIADVGTTSNTHLYEAGGQASGGVQSNQIQKWPASADDNATDEADLTVARQWGSQSSSATHGYYAVGQSPSFSNVIDKYSHSVDANATDVGDASTARSRTASFTDDTNSNGYIVMGRAPPTGTNELIKYSHTSDGNSTGTSTLGTTVQQSAGSCSTTHGYNMGGIYSYNGYKDDIYKYVFATDANAGDVGSLTTTRWDNAGVSSSTHGYTIAGSGVPGETNIIENFPFSSDGNMTDVGDLTAVTSRNSGTQT